MSSRIIYLCYSLFWICSCGENDIEEPELECATTPYELEITDIQRNWDVSFQQIEDEMNKFHSCSWYRSYQIPDDPEAMFGEPFDISFEIIEPIVVSEKTGMIYETREGVCLSFSEMELILTFSQNGEEYSVLTALMMNGYSSSSLLGMPDFEFGEIALPEGVEDGDEFSGYMKFYGDGDGGSVDSRGSINSITIKAFLFGNDQTHAIAYCEES